MNAFLHSALAQRGTRLQDIKHAKQTKHQQKQKRSNKTAIKTRKTITNPKQQQLQQPSRLI